MKTDGMASRIAVLVVALVLLFGCGGGGGNPGGGTPPPVSTLTITTDQQLPRTLQGAAYSTTLAASGGQGALTWSIAAISPTALFPTGLTINASSGVLSGTANFGGTAGFIATVSDSSQTATKTFYVTAYGRLTASNLTATVQAYVGARATLQIQGGVPPLSYAVTSGALPPGVKLDLSFTSLSGTPTVSGNFQSTVEIRDSYTPPQTASMQVNLTVSPSILTAASAIPDRLVLNRPFTGRLIGNGGTPPYTFSITSGELLAGLVLSDPATGEISGTPTATGSRSFTFQVTDSSSPPQTAYGWATTWVSAALGRNDSIQTATPLGNTTQLASISPYIDPPATATPGDQDFYKVIAVAGQTLHAETNAKRTNPKNPLDTVLEIVDGNGQRLNWCNQPGDTTGNFNSACLNDDLSASPHVQDSALDLRVPGAANTAAVVYVHVLDWRGDARPDMSYTIALSGAVNPLTELGSMNLDLRYLPVNQAMYPSTFNGYGGVPPYSWSATSLPPGLTVSSTGTLSGTPTVLGTYKSTITLADSMVPPLSTSYVLTIMVEEPPHFLTTSLPDAYTGQPYKQEIVVTGGTLPYTWSYSSGTISAEDGKYFYKNTYTMPMSFDLAFGVWDAHNLVATVHIPFTVKPGPLTVRNVSFTWPVGATNQSWIYADGGTPGFTCSILSGSLPPGVTLTNNYYGSSCVIIGPATATGTYSAVIQMQDSGQPPQTATTTGTFTITP